jgi:hypothetical protein
VSLTQALASLISPAQAETEGRISELSSRMVQLAAREARRIDGRGHLEAEVGPFPSMPCARVFGGASGSVLFVLPVLCTF